jgi:hypothetical protein
MKTIRLIALGLAVLAALLLGQGQHTALADGEYGTLYIDVLPDASNTTTGYGTVDVCRDTEDDGVSPLDVGDTFTIDVLVSLPVGVSSRGALYAIDYDNTVLQVNDYDWSSWKYGSGVGINDTLPDTDGEFNASWSRSAPAINGSGVITRITLEAVGDGQSDLKFYVVQGAGGQPIIVDASGTERFPPEVLVDDPPGNVRVVVGGACASPVGGIAELPGVSDSSAPNYIALAGLAAAAALVALTGGALYARRRWLR